jgi:hypothetical protein
MALSVDARETAAGPRPAPELAGTTGLYFEGRAPARAHSQAYDERARRDLWA